MKRFCPFMSSGEGKDCNDCCVFRLLDDRNDNFHHCMLVKLSIKAICFFEKDIKSPKG
jgi:hypothetical protein